MSEKKQYDSVARTFHGVMAVVSIGLLAVGSYMSDLDPSPQKWQMYGMHKAIGMTVLALVVLRILWRVTHRVPAPLGSWAVWERGLATIVQTLLYLGMIVMPISGYVMSSAGGHDISIFGLFNVPLVIEKNEALGHAARAVHGLAGNVVIGAVALHFIGAMKHHLIDRDRTLHRMFAFIR